MNKRRVLFPLFLLLLTGCTVKWQLPFEIPNNPVLAALQVDTKPKAQVYINNSLVGTSPLQNKRLKPGNYTILLKTDQTSWTGRVTLTSSTVTIVSKDLSGETEYSPGYVASLEKGSGIAIIGTPIEATVSIDKQIVGSVPYSSQSIAQGSHDISVSAPGFTPLQLKTKTTEGFRLVINMNLKPSALISEPISSPTTSANPLSSTSIPSLVRQVRVKTTSTGWLRIRQTPSLSSTEVFKVNAGDILEVLDTQSGWIKIKTQDNKEGWGSQMFLENLSLR